MSRPKFYVVNPDPLLLQLQDLSEIAPVNGKASEAERRAFEVTNVIAEDYEIYGYESIRRQIGARINTAVEQLTRDHPERRFMAQIDMEFHTYTVKRIA